MSVAVRSAPLPVARFSRFAPRSAADVNVLYSRLIRDHRLRLAPRRGEAVAELRHAPLQRTALSTSHLASDMSIEASPSVDSYLVFLFRRGEGGTVRLGARRYALGSGAAAIVAPGRDFGLTLPAGTDTVILRVACELVDAALRAALGRPTAGPLSFDDDGFLPAERAGGLAGLLALVEREIEISPATLGIPAHLATLEAFLASSLVCGTAHDYRARLQSPDGDPRPRHVRRALAWIEAHADDALDLPALARRVAVSPRTLARGFRRHAGCTPADYARAVRLERARAELLAGPRERLSVAGVAARWGFGHPGRFASLYRERYGEYPAQTLRRRGAGIAPRD